MFSEFVCQARAGYRTETTVTPGAEAHQYVVQFKITGTGKEGKADKTLSMPAIITKAGEEGRCTLGDDKERNGVFQSCTVLVKETETGIEAVTTVIVKVLGAEELNTSQTISVKK